MKYFLLSLTLVLTTALTTYSQTATFSGRVTDQNTGVGIPDVAIVAVGNQTGARVAITDAQGNYTLPMGTTNNNIKLRAYRPNFLFNPLQTPTVKKKLFYLPADNILNSLKIYLKNFFVFRRVMLNP